MSNGGNGPIERHHPRLDALVALDSALEVVVDMSGHEGPHWLESPTWDARSGSLLFSDVKANAIWRWEPERGISLFMRPSGYTGEPPFAGQEPGANGLAFDSQGRLMICEHGDRRVCRLEADGRKTVLADRYNGRRLNSPRILVLSLQHGTLQETEEEATLRPSPLPEASFQISDQKRQADGRHQRETGLLVPIIGEKHAGHDVGDG